MEGSQPRTIPMGEPLAQSTRQPLARLHSVHAIGDIVIAGVLVSIDEMGGIVPMSLPTGQA
jgi:hypothetical protein